MKKNPANSKSTEPKPLDLDLRPGQSIELLKELHILTREGKLNQDSRRKLKQVLHLFQFIEKLLQELPANEHGPTLADHGEGKSYWGFIIYELFFKALGRGTIYGIETRAELVESSRALAQHLGFERMQFLNLTVAQSAQSDALPERIDVVTALHACDTATDDAIAFGLQKKARFMVLANRIWVSSSTICFSSSCHKVIFTASKRVLNWSRPRGLWQSAWTFNAWSF